jgi:hypothetical protein
MWLEGMEYQVSFINRQRQFYPVGLDIFRPALSQAKKATTHDDYILADIRKLPIREKSFDVALCLEVIEHLEKEEGAKFLKEIEKISRKQIIITTPVGKFERPPTGGNPWQEHKSTYSPTELRAYGYQIWGYGLPMLGGDRGLITRLPEPLASIKRFIWVLASVITYFAPELAGWMVATKSLKTGLAGRQFYGEF